MAVTIAIPDIKAALIDRMPEVCHALLSGGRRVAGEWVCGSVQGDRGRSLSVRLYGNKAGVWSDFSSGEKGGPWELIMACRGCTFRDALSWALNFLGQDPPPRREWAPDMDDQRRQDLARDIWAAGRPVVGTPAETYLRSRGLEPGDSLAYHPALRHSPGHTGPALLAAVTDSAGVFRAIHRIWLTPGVSPRKKSLGPCSRHSVRLAPVASRLGIAEGIETALAAAQIFGIPTWATIGTAGLKSVRLPAEVSEVVIFADSDEPGRQAARQAGERLRAEIYEAPFGDWNDVLTERLAEHA